MYSRTGVKPLLRSIIDSSSASTSAGHSYQPLGTAASDDLELDAMASYYDGKPTGNDAAVTSVAADTIEPSASSPSHTNDDSNEHVNAVAGQGIHLLEAKSTRWWSYLATPDFWIVVAIGQVLALCITSTNTFSSFLAAAGTSIPAFQTIFNYILLFLIYTSYFLYRDGPREYARVAWKHGWKYLIMSFLDVEGNYFTVLAYRYTNILSAQLINFWAIVVVVIISFLFLKVRYRLFQVIGIFVAIGGMGMLIGSDHITGSNGGPGEDLLRGDLFALLGATFYGLGNVFEEYLVSQHSVPHVLSFMGLFGAIINGVQAAIFDRQSFRDATWNGDVAGWLVGFTLCLCLFYTLVPLLLRMGSAAFLNISLLTANFWGVIIGIRVFGYSVHFLYPIAFVCIILGLVTYFLSGSLFGESKKPWLGQNQERGVVGVGTAKRKAIHAARNAAAEPEAGVAQQ
ncbi:hypothetical protein S7711_05764 [Stachybotrys chartarum IBT 7711]|uniref:EamA domain-containing protein n=1 Tax=Stachybotrys chartarum (strain CBS 109288 / IBT 7711) TaxID=1280523 RepID=A0A084ATE9_STACB|nr:hypothetical protein S7711_05764 [Stachybotrys chartarum IBT 7711]KFA51217.1 hypothetical protein S40293_05095 [Stachybotrys chartarum IBT 40293]KFA75929.1 hypothetical protein S40288_05866 [Stachybotrys chartarum IBT 40288]